MTTAPGYLTESELIGLMEKHGIGTDASMATHINNICEREYVQVTGQSRQLVPTKIGLALVHGYQKIDQELVDSNLRSSIEKSVDQIAKGEKDYQAVLDQVIAQYQKKYDIFVSNISQLDEIFHKEFKNLDDQIETSKPFSSNCF